MGHAELVGAGLLLGRANLDTAQQQTIAFPALGDRQPASRIRSVVHADLGLIRARRRAGQHQQAVVVLDGVARPPAASWARAAGRIAVALGPDVAGAIDDVGEDSGIAWWLRRGL